MAGETSAGKLVVEIVGDIAGLTRAYEEAKKQTEGFEGDLKTIGQSLSKTGQDLSLKVTAPLALMGGIALSTASSFDDSMRKVAAVTGATGDQFDRLRQQAIDLGASTAWSASESAAAMQYLGMAGLDTNEILEATPQMLSLASAGAMDLAVAADIATNVLSGFNLQVSDLAHVSDVLAQAASSSNTSVEQLGHAMAYVGPVASSAGLSIEETTAAIQVMSNSGIQGTMAGTALRGALTSLLSPTKQATDILATYGLTAEDVNPEVHSLAEILDTLSSAGLSTADAMSLFGDRAGPAMLSLIRAGGDGIRDYTTALDNCDGAAQRMAETMEGGVGGSLRELEGAVETLSITFGDLIAEAIMPAIEAATGLANWLSNLDEGTQRVIVATGLFAAAVGPATWAVGTLAGSVGSLITLHRTYQASTIAATIATKGFTAAIMANPLGLAIIGVTTLGAVLLPLIASTNDATEAQEEYNAALRETADLTGKTTEEIEDEIDILKEREQQILANIEALQSQTVVTERGTLKTRQATEATGWHKLATGDLTREYEDTTDAIKDGTVALGKMTQAQKDAALAAANLKLEENRAAQAIRDTELQTRRLADGAKTAYDQASKAVSGHQKAVTGLQKEYDKLKETIDRALGIDDEIEDAGRDVERADIRRIRAKQDLADLDEELAQKERELQAGNYRSIEEREKAERDLTDLRLRRREAVLDLADAEDRYQDAIEEASAKQAEKVETEKALNGESVESAQGRLEEIKKQIDDETAKLQNALTAREEAQVAHENLMSEIENEALDVKSANWAEYVKFMDVNPAYGRTYHVEYDKDGNMIGEPPELPARTIPVPSYASPAFETATSSTADVAGGAGATAAAEAGLAVPDEVSGDLTREFRDTTDAIEDGTIALGNLTQAEKDAALAAATLELAENQAAQAIRDTELQTRRLADGAKTAYDQASKAVTAHQKTVSDLQKEYNELEETINKALGIDEEIKDADREVERADSRRIQAERDLADIREEIKKKRAEAAGGDADAKRVLEDLLLRERGAVLDVAEAQDRYQDALKAASDAQQERTDIETELNGESISSAQARLDEIGRMLEEEQGKLDVALENREQAQVAHENLMSQIENEALDVKSANWADYVKYVNDNPAIARTYHVEYDENGNPIGGLPQIPKIQIQVPTYSSPAFAAATQSTAAVAGGAGASPAVAATLSSSEPPLTPEQVRRQTAAAGMYIESLNVYSPAADASTMMNTTKRTLRNIGTQVAL